MPLVIHLLVILASVIVLITYSTYAIISLRRRKAHPIRARSYNLYLYGMRLTIRFWIKVTVVLLVTFLIHYWMQG